jgi:hypothetical protein
MVRSHANEVQMPPAMPLDLLASHRSLLVRGMRVQRYLQAEPMGRSRTEKFDSEVLLPTLLPSKMPSCEVAGTAEAQ